MNVRLGNGKYCHEKCRQTKKCCLCIDFLTIPELKKPILFLMDCGYVKSVRYVRGALYFLMREI